MTETESAPTEFASETVGRDQRPVAGRLVRRTQAAARITARDARVPARAVPLHRADRPWWTFQVGTSGRPDRPLASDTLFRMGSITKTFTAVMVMQCRDERRLDLDDPISSHLPLPAHGDL